MTATDKLRNLLDERGVEWKEEGPNKTKWSHGGIEYLAVNAWPRNGGKTRLILHANITPEQAIEATLGRGTCKLTMNGTNGCFGCSECLENIPPLANFCPNCGREVTAR